MRAAQAVVFFLEEKKNTPPLAPAATRPSFCGYRKCNNLRQQQPEFPFNLSRSGRARRSAAAARAATLEDSTPTRTHAHHTHRRGLLYLRREAHGPRTDRPCVPLASDVPGTQTANQILSSNLEESRTTWGVSFSPSAGVEPQSAAPHSNCTRIRSNCVRLGTHALSLHPPLRAQMSAARGACGRAELALRRRCVGCPAGGAAPRAKGLSGRLAR